MSNRALSGYAMAIGEKLLSIFDHTGPKNYQTGGETLYGPSVGIAGFDVVHCSQFTLSGSYRVIVLYPLSGTDCVQSVKLAWYDSITGIEVLAGTDLSNEHLRVDCVGA